MMKPSHSRPFFPTAAFLPAVLAGLVIASSAEPSPAPYLTLTQSQIDAFGHAIARAGDVNADGFEDLIVGAPGQAYGMDHSTGRAFLFFGGFSADSVADRTFSSPSSSIQRGFGSSVAGLGDLNGDGFSDVAVGSPYDADAYGRVYLYWGGPNLDAAPDLVLGDGTVDPGFGHVVSSVGDINGDGFPDLLVGSFGASSVFYGGPQLDTLPDLTLPASQGILDASAAGDIDLDGCDDFIVGTGTGAVFYRGSADPDSIADVRIPGTSDGRAVGYAVAAGGDLDGDGAGDLVVGAPGFLSPIVPPDGGSPPPGRVYVYRGGPALDATPDYILERSVDGDEFGAAVAIEDVTGDDIPELLVGAPGLSYFEGSPPARAFVFGGAPRFQALYEWSIWNSDLGRAIAAADLNGDRIADVVVSAPGIAPVHDGMVYVFDVGSALSARAFVLNEHRVLALSSAHSAVCFWLEALGESFQNSDLDLPSFRLRSQGTGSVGEIAALPSKDLTIGDADRNGVPDIRICFDRGDLGQLFSFIRGRREVELTLSGRLASGRAVMARFGITVVGIPASSRHAGIAPNPMNPRGRLEFTLQSASPVTVRLYDPNGRRVRTVLEGAIFPQGEHSVDIDGRDDRGRPLASGVYFYQLTWREGETRGRFVIAK